MAAMPSPTRPVVQRAFDGREAAVDRRKIGVARRRLAHYRGFECSQSLGERAFGFGEALENALHEGLVDPWQGHGRNNARCIECALRIGVEQMAGATVRRSTRRAERAPEVAR